jgi:hypothetical protein
VLTSNNKEILILILSIQTGQTVKIFMGRKQQLPTATRTDQHQPNKNLEGVLTQHMKTTHGHIDALSNNHEKYQRNTEASIKNLETQIGQISTQLAHIEEAKKGVQDGCE